MDCRTVVLLHKYKEVVKLRTLFGQINLNVCSVNLQLRKFQRQKYFNREFFYFETRSGLICKKKQII